METAGKSGDVPAPAGAATVPRSMAVAHSTAALRPDPVKTMCRNPVMIRLEFLFTARQCPGMLPSRPEAT